MKLNTKLIIIFIELTITTILFNLAYNYEKLNFDTLIVNLLLFIIVFEIVRTIIEFIFNQNIINLRYIIDGTILFFIREVMLMFQKHSLEHINLTIGIIIILFTLRHIEFFYEIKRKKLEIRK